MALTQLMTLCRFASEIGLESVPTKVVDHAKLVLLDTIGVMTAGAQSDEVSSIGNRLPEHVNPQDGVTCPGRMEKLHPLSAALLNGIAGSSMEYEEGNSRAMGHPAIQVVPAVVAASESSGRSGADLLSGFISGYEVGSRVSRASSLRKGLHPTGTWGTVGSAAGVARIGRKSPNELLGVVNIAASYAFSPWVKNSFVGKNISSTFAGIVNHHGLLANLFFESGIEADDDSFEMTFSRFVSENLNPDVLISNLGQEYDITENYFKPYPSCRFTHPAIDALNAILQRTQVLPSEVTSITVASFKAAVHTSSQPPFNVDAMRFSVPYMIATLLSYGNIDLETLQKDPLHNLEVKELAKKVEMIFSPEYEAMRPINNPAKVTIQLRDGKELSHEVMNCLGDPVNPMPREAIHTKFLSLAEPVIGPDRAQRFLRGITHLEYEKDVRPLLTLLRPKA